ncbi:hypothetical protein [Streptomyces sioyaensis]|uniref:hypothetical protein n=1 Tax=Streptomyces sioyaensis TaxID=67364 RepID=UPI003D713EC3
MSDLPRPERNAALNKGLESGAATTDWGSSFIWGPQVVITVPAHERPTYGHSGKGAVVGAVRIVYSTGSLTDRL